MIVIPNEKLLAVAKDAGFFESFRIADDVLRQGVQGISDIITIPGIINRDFADVKTTMAGMGHAVMGTAVRSGANRAIEAAQAAMASPLLEAGAIDGARGILINITGSSSLKLSEVNEASTLIQSAAHEDANIIFGAVLDEKMGEEVKITVIATGFRDQQPERRARMLSVEEAPVVSVPLVAVPVEEPSAWMSEEPAAPAPPAAPRFKSEEEDEEEGKSESAFFFSSEPAVATSVTVSGGPSSLDRAFDPEPETVATAAHLEDMEQESAQARQPRDYAHDFTEGLNVQPGNIQPVLVQPVDAQPVVEPEPLFPEASEAEQRDLDVPAFLRRLQF